MEVDINKYVPKLASFLAKKDALDFNLRGEDGAHRTWEEIPQLGQEQYTQDAQLIVQAMMLMNWGPARVAQMGLLADLVSIIRKDKDMPPGLRGSLAKWLKSIHTQIKADYNGE